MASRSLGTATAQLAKEARETPPVSQDLIKLLLIGRMIGDSCGGILQLVASENTDDSFIRLE